MHACWREMETFAEIYKEACLLDLKYNHLAEVCESLLQPWHNRDSSGRIVKKAVKEVDSTVQATIKRPEEPVQENDSAKAEGITKELADLQLLDNILSKAQHIREGEDTKKISKKVTAKSIAMATQAYSESRQPNKKVLHKTGASTVKAKHSSLKTDSTNSAHPHKGRTAKIAVPTNKHGSLSRNDDITAKKSIGSNLYKTTRERTVESTASVGREGQSCGDDVEECKNVGFQVQVNGQRLSMPSRYTKLHKLLTRINAQLRDTISQETVNKAAEHFTKRLLSEEPPDSASVVHLLLKLEEYVHIKRELMAVTPKEWSVSDKSQWQEVLRVKSKVDSALETLQHLQRGQLDHPSEIHPSPMSNGASSPSSRVADFESRLGYTELKHLQELALLEQLVIIEAWEAELFEYIQSTVLPIIMNHREHSPLVCGLIQCVRSLLGSGENTPSYLLVDHE